MCGFMDTASGPSTDTPPWPHTTRQPRVPQVKSLLQQQSSATAPPQNVPSHKEVPEIPAVSQLWAACRIPEQWHSLGSAWCCGSGPCGGITPRGAQQTHLGSYKPCPVPEPKHKIPIQVRFRKGGAFLCNWEFEKKLTTNWKPAAFCVLTAPVSIPCEHPEHSCSVSPSLVILLVLFLRGKR